MNPYEVACERVERARRMCRDIRAALARIEDVQITAEAEWADATRDLRAYETTPGIPLPQYRQEVTA